LRVNRRVLFKLILGSLGASVLSVTTYVAVNRDEWWEKRVRLVEAGRLVRGAWQRPGPLRQIIARERIRTIVTLTAINAADPKFRDQAGVVKQLGVRWLIVPMRGSRATHEQMALAADLLADPARQPVFFHCVAGHHRTSLAHSAYLIRHRGYTAEQAWQAVSSLPWARPDSDVDRNDRFLIEEFARVQRSLAPSPEHGVWEIGHGTWPQETEQVDREAGRGDRNASPVLDRLEPSDVQLRGSAARPQLPVGADACRGARADSS
jgi:protein tyrosine phosphatase (PTP) superfamily phosphohydrolase (DUF442 family)